MDNVLSWKIQVESVDSRVQRHLYFLCSVISRFLELTKNNVYFLPCGHREYPRNGIKVWLCNWSVPLKTQIAYKHGCEATSLPADYFWADKHRKLFQIPPMYFTPSISSSPQADTIGSLIPSSRHYRVPPSLRQTLQGPSSPQVDAVLVHHLQNRWIC